MLEDVRCNLCGADDASDLFHKDGLNVAHCKACGLVYVNPREVGEKQEQFYDGGYFSSPVAQEKGYTSYLASRPLKIATFNKRLSEIEDCRQGGRILDVGCAAGFFLEVARDRGWEPYGMDISHAVVVQARERLGTLLVQGTLEEAAFPADCFDLITMFDVVEHLPNPMQTLREANRILAKEGVVAIGTPNVESLSARVMRRNWPHLKPREHLYYFSPKTLSHMLNRAGFQVLKASGAGKTLAPRYLYTELARTNPVLSRLLSFFANLLQIADHSVHIKVGEMIVIAVKSQDAEARRRFGEL